MKSKLEFALGLAKKAGAVKSGTEAVRDEVRGGRAKFVILACDASDNTKKRVTDCCRHYGVTLYTPSLTTDTLGASLGSSALVAAASLARHGVSKLVESALKEENCGAKSES